MRRPWVLVALCLALVASTPFAVAGPSVGELACDDEETVDGCLDVAHQEFRFLCRQVFSGGASDMCDLVDARIGSPGDHVLCAQRCALPDALLGPDPASAGATAAREECERVLGGMECRVIG